MLRSVAFSDNVFAGFIESRSKCLRCSAFQNKPRIFVPFNLNWQSSQLIQFDQKEHRISLYAIYSLPIQWRQIEVKPSDRQKKSLAALKPHAEGYESQTADLRAISKV